LRKYLLMYLDEGKKYLEEIKSVLKDYLPTEYLINDVIRRLKKPHYTVTLATAGDTEKDLSSLIKIAENIISERRGWKGLKIAVLEVKMWIEIEDWYKAKVITFDEEGKEHVKIH